AGGRGAPGEKPIGPRNGGENPIGPRGRSTEKRRGGEAAIEITEEDKADLTELFNHFVLDIMGLQQDKSSSDSSGLTDELMELILNLRKEAKSNKDYATADKIRDVLTEANVTIKDTREGTTWSYDG
ncbi:MAG: hypothetical protein HRT74_10395, partial [Flavobacteriales bacterium]|nr:hypothetical protein [Flavobacteriales bacterium]